MRKLREAKSLTPSHTSWKNFGSNVNPSWGGRQTTAVIPAFSPHPTEPELHKDANHGLFCSLKLKLLRWYQNHSVYSINIYGMKFQESLV